MAAQIETILTDLKVLILGFDRGVEMLGQADSSVDRSIQAAQRGGFVAVAEQLRTVQHDIHETRLALANTRRALMEAVGPVADALVELSAEQITVLLSPV